MSAIRQDLTRTTLAVICILLLIAGSLWVLRPFLAATVWATMLVVTTWPMLEYLQARLGNRRAPAVALMTLGMLLLLVIPLWAAIATIVEHADRVGDLAKQVADAGLPQPPEWVAKVPVVGKRLSATLAAWANAGPGGLEARLGPYVSDAARWAVDQAGSLGGMLRPVPAGRDSLRRHVLEWRVGGERRSPFRPASRRASGARTPSSWRERPFAAWRWASA